MKIELKNNIFEAIQVTGEINQFSELKTFCSADNIKITYETAPGIGDYWLIELYSDLKNKWETVPNSNYIVKNIKDNYLFIIDPIDFNCHFNVLDN